MPNTGYCTSPRRCQVLIFFQKLFFEFKKWRGNATAGNKIERNGNLTTGKKNKMVRQRQWALPANAITDTRGRRIQMPV